MSELAFISTGAAPTASPLSRALAGALGLGDLSLLGKLEVRGPAGGLAPDGAELITITPSRALVVCEPERTAALRDSLPGVVIDMTSALAGIELESPEVMRRLTDLDLAALPAAGKFAGVPALVSQSDAGFRVFFPQEFGDSVVTIVRDIQEGLR
jgi:hypothetical protein